MKYSNGLSLEENMKIFEESWKLEVEGHHVIPMPKHDPNQKEYVPIDFSSPEIIKFAKRTLDEMFGIVQVDNFDSHQIRADYLFENFDILSLAKQGIYPTGQLTEGGPMFLNHGVLTQNPYSPEHLMTEDKSRVTLSLIDTLKAKHLNDNYNLRQLANEGVYPTGQFTEGGPMFLHDGKLTQMPYEHIDRP